MESETTQTQTRKNDLVLVRETNEWGQLTDLDKNATYFVIRKPTRELTQQKSREFVDDVRSFLHEHRVLSEKQFDELNTRYGEPAKAKAKELRETMEKKFDEIAKEFETRVEQIESEYKARFGRDAKTPKESSASGAPGETPGEMPTGESHANLGDEPKKAGAKKPVKKTE
jgi:DNA anti-recombination protein RmuC